MRLRRRLARGALRDQPVHWCRLRGTWDLRTRCVHMPRRVVGVQCHHPPATVLLKSLYPCQRLCGCMRWRICKQDWNCCTYMYVVATLTVLVPAGTCTCSGGHTGAHCEIGPDPCASQPCQRGGICTGGAGANSFSCACPNQNRQGFVGGWSGPTCSDGTHSPDCLTFYRCGSPYCMHRCGSGCCRGRVTCDSFGNSADKAHC